MNTYKGFTVADVSTRTDDGRYRARAAIMSLNGERTRSQRFLDLEIFRTMEEAHQRTMAVAMLWIDESLAHDRLALPTHFSPPRIERELAIGQSSSGLVG